MAADRWQQVSQIYHAALQRDTADRDAFLREACAGDEGLRREVESLLGYQAAGDRLIERPAAEVAVPMLEHTQASPSLVGRQIGPYTITSRIDAGGMGEVYRARDTKLGRDVAIKILAREFIADADRRARFAREARLLAALNHPHIAQIYGFEESGDLSALVMELVPGETLAEIIQASGRRPRASGSDGALTVTKSLTIARQIADALEAAHEKGIIHRDLKPANVIIQGAWGPTPTRDKTAASRVRAPLRVEGDLVAKVVDFGLAKVIDQASDVGPTITADGTRAGTILGTAAYMSPEQARGQPVDKRTDIWAFGCVLYEMLTGRAAFPGDTISDTLAKILEREPDWAALPEDVPPGIADLLRRCLEKEHKARIPEVAAVRYLLDALAAKPPVAVGTTLAQGITTRRHWLSVVAIALVVGVLAAAAAWWLKRVPAVRREVVTRFTYLLPEGQNFTRPGRHVLAISPDGTKLVYVANNQLYLRPMDQLDAQPIRGTNEDPIEPVFSPDGQWIAYFVPAPGEVTLKKIAVTGGGPVTLAQLPGSPYGATWQSGTIAFGTSASGIVAVPENGGAPRTLIASDAKTEQLAQPEFLDDGKRLIFVVISRVGAGAAPQVVVQALTGGERTVLVQRGTNPHILPSGALVYIDGGTLLAVPFDMKQLTVRGGAVSIVDGVSETDITRAGQFAISSNGTLVFQPERGNLRTLVWVDRNGNEEAIPAPPRFYVMPRLSPDGTRIAVDSDDEEHDIWVFDRTKKTLTRLTFGPAAQGRPLWTPDGRSVLFAEAPGPSLYSSGRDILRQSADGTGTAEALTQHQSGGLPWSVSRDGMLIYETHSNLSVLLLDRPAESRPLLDDPKFQEWGSALSPDGHYLAYSSNLSGRHQVYVRPFPSVDSGRWQVSIDGGAWPRWARSGRELFFVKDSAAGSVRTQEFLAVQVQPGGTFGSGTPRMLFKASAYNGFFDVDVDDKRFLMVKVAGPGSSVPSSIVVVSHWFDELRARMGALTLETQRRE